MSLPDKDLKPLECCACHKVLKVRTGSDALNSGWDLEEDEKGNPFDLCNKCKTRAECQDARLKLRMGLAAGKIPPQIKVKKDSLKKIRDVVAKHEREGYEHLPTKSKGKKGRVLEPEKEATQKVRTRAVLTKTALNRATGVTVRARFKLISLDVTLGEKVLTGGPLNGAIELTPDVMDKLEMNQEYFINLSK